MKKVFTLLTLVMLMIAAGANAQSRKSWDFTKGVSDETRAAMDADAAQWTKNVNGEGVSTNWVSNVSFTGELTAGGNVIPEFAGLTFGDFAATNAVSYFGTRLRLQKGCSITLPTLTEGQKVTIKAQSANATATDRGFAFVNAAITEGPENGIALGRDAEGAPEGGVTTFVLTAQGGAVIIKTGLSGTPASGAEILSIIIDEGDKNIKTWDFTKWSEATKTQVCAAEDWTKSESASKSYITGDEIRWILTPSIDLNENLEAGNAAIKEMMGLRHTGLAAYSLGMAFDYQTTTDGNNWGPYASPSYLWVMGNATTIVVPNVKAGSTLKVASESHKPTEARGFNVSVEGGAAITANEGANTSMALSTFTYTVPADGDEYVNIVLKATKGCHLYSIEAEVKDETIVDKNPFLGAPAYSIKDGAKVNLQTSNLTITFPKYKNMEPNTTVQLLGYLGPKEVDPAEVEDHMFYIEDGTVGGDIKLSFDDFGIVLEENTEYKFYLLSITVDGYEKLNMEAAEGEELYPMSFMTTGHGIDEPRKWQFTNSADDTEAIKESVANGYGYWAASSKGRYQYAMPLSQPSTLMLDPETPLPITDGLLFTMGSANDILVGTPEGNNGRLQLGGGAPSLIIPSCSEGDEVTITALWSTKNAGVITITNGTAADNTNTITLTGSAADYKIKVTENGDLVLASKNTVYTAIEVFPSSIEKKDINYSVVAQDPDGNDIVELAKGTGKTNDQVSYGYSYWVADKDGNLYTRGTRGNPFTETITLNNETEKYTVAYKKANIDAGFVKAVFCAEGEDLPGATLIEKGNVAIRASKGLAACAYDDIEICKLQPGTYKIMAAVWDATKGGGSTTLTFKAGENEYSLTSTGDNMSEVNLDDDVIEITEETALIWTMGGDEDPGHGLDAIVVYTYDPDAVDTVASEVENDAQVVKYVNANGQVRIATANGAVINVAGQEVAE